MNRIIFLNDIFDVRNNGPVPRSQILTDDRRSEMIAQVQQDSRKFPFWSRYLGPYAVGNSIKQSLPDWDVVIVDYFTKIENFHDYISKLITPETKYIALSTTFLHNPFNNRKSAFNLWCFSQEELIDWFKKIKDLAPHVEFIIGGSIVDTLHAVYVQNKKDKLPEALNTYISYAFHGYGEDTIIKFLTGTLPPEDIQKKGNVNFVNELKLAGSGAKVLKMKWNKSYAVQPNEWLPLEISKGCIFGCKFCFYDRNGSVIKKPDVLRDELLYNYEHFGVSGYSLTDDTVNDSPEKIDMMHDVISNLPFKIEWVSYARPDMFYKFPEMYHKMIDMGCRGMFLGVETLTHRAGKIAGKGLHPDKIKQILNWLKEVGKDEVFILASFIIGLIGETEESLMATAEWLRDQRCLDKAQYEILFLDDTGNRTPTVFGSNKDKFGIKKIQWNPEYYWEHGTLNLTQCKEIALKWEAMMDNHPFTRCEKHAKYNTSFWAYPRIRSFGYNHHEAVHILKTDPIHDSVYEKSLNWINKYHDIILTENTKK